MKLLDKPFRHDVRSKNFSHSRFFGTVNAASLPDTLGRPCSIVENQQQTNRCAAYAGATNGGYIYGRRMHPDFLAILIGKQQGRSVDIDGSDPNAAMKAQCVNKGGYLPYEDAMVNLTEDGPTTSGNPASYPAFCEEESHNLGGQGFVTPDGGQDIFDSIRIALFMAYDPVTKRGATVQSFGKWYYEWWPGNFNPNYVKGIIPTTYSNFIGYHSRTFIDWVTINGVAHLVEQNSWGPDVGDNGFFYYPREVVNREFGNWGTTLKILKPLTQEQIALAKQTTPFGKIQNFLIQCWYNLSIYIMGKYGF